MRHRLAGLFAILVMIASGEARAQGPQQLPFIGPVRFTSWHADPPVAYRVSPMAFPAAAPRHRFRNAVIGGVIGAAAGVAFCTAMSTLIDDSASGGISTCPLDSYLYIGGAGFALGFGIGWIV